MSLAGVHAGGRLRRLFENLAKDNSLSRIGTFEAEEARDRPANFNAMTRIEATI